jgi:hypothetical protein
MVSIEAAGHYLAKAPGCFEGRGDGAGRLKNVGRRICREGHDGRNVRSRVRAMTQHGCMPGEALGSTFRRRHEGGQSDQIRRKIAQKKKKSQKLSCRQQTVFPYLIALAQFRTRKSQQLKMIEEL